MKCCQPFPDHHQGFVFFEVLLTEITGAEDCLTALGFAKLAWSLNMQTKQFKTDKLVELKCLERRPSRFH